MILDNPYIKSGPHTSERGTLYVMECPNGYGIAGSGWSRCYATLKAAQKAFDRLYKRGYEASVITHPNNPRGFQYAVLVSRYGR